MGWTFVPEHAIISFVNAGIVHRLVYQPSKLRRWVIEHNEGGANKDLAKFADQINALCDKWDR